jgi:hypothetical protein
MYRSIASTSASRERGGTPRARGFMGSTGVDEARPDASRYGNLRICRRHGHNGSSPYAPGRAVSYILGVGARGAPQIYFCGEAGFDSRTPRSTVL